MPPELAWKLQPVSTQGDRGSSRRERLVSGNFEQLKGEALPEGPLRVVAVPRKGRMPFFEGLVLERETGLEPSTLIPTKPVCIRKPRTEMHE